MPSSVTPLKIWTGVTVLYPNMSGVPSSVNAQMSTMLPPARRPGLSMGRVMRRNLCHGPAPALRADSSRDGSMFANAVTRLR